MFDNLINQAWHELPIFSFINYEFYELYEIFSTFECNIKTNNREIIGILGEMLLEKYVKYVYLLIIY